MRKLYETATLLSWDALVFFLPLTSLPLLSKVMGGTNVAPISAVFLAILVFIWLVPGLVHHRALPYPAVPLLVFFFLALLSSFLAFFLPVPTFKNEGIWKNLLSSLVTLGVGTCFYLVASLWLSDESKLAHFFRIVNLSGGIALIYSLLQAVFIIGLNNPPAALYRFQNLISSSQTLFIGRINGLAFEPSWLAHQLNMFYIPIWAGLTIKKVSFHKFRLSRLSIENLLLAASCVVLFLSKSRIGWLAFLAFTAYLLIRLMDTFRRRLLARLTSKWRGKGNPKWAGVLFNAIFWLTFVLILFGGLLLAGWVLTRVDPRMVQLFDLQTIKNQGILGWAAKLVFAERIVYWLAGMAVFLHYPVFGVGLGNSGYFLPPYISSFGLSSPEILRIFLQYSFLPNPKNLWVRILAETGIVGFSVFVSWLWSEWKVSRSLERFSPPLAQAMGLTGQIVLVGLILEGFSLDTFALPYYWMTLGLIVAVQRVFTSKQSSSSPGQVHSSND